MKEKTFLHRQISGNSMQEAPIVSGVKSTREMPPTFPASFSTGLECSENVPGNHYEVYVQSCAISRIWRKYGSNCGITHRFVYQLFDKHHINCEYSIAMSLLIVRSQWLSWTQVIHCLKCQQVHKSCLCQICQINNICSTKTQVLGSVEFVKISMFLFCLLVFFLFLRHRQRCVTRNVPGRRGFTFQGVFFKLLFLYDDAVEAKVPSSVVQYLDGPDFFFNVP